jgi:hypothetical protein
MAALRRERPRPRPGLALGTLFPEFDELARPIKRRVNHVAVAALPISFGPRSWQACLARSHIPPFLTPSGMRRSSGGAGRLNAYAKKPGSTLMQQEKAI